jgi:predicted lipoprotein with Yx(FWY)xxD motif
MDMIRSVVRTRVTVVSAGLACLLALAGCTSGTTSSGDPGTGGAATPPPSAVSASPSSEGTDDGAASTELEVEDSALGQIVVDGKGMTVYMFDKDTQGTTTSACTGQCLENWPIVPAGSGEPKADGVTGSLAAIDTPDGGKQLTLNGWPLYYFAGDAAAGDTNGQGVNAVWWVLSPAGEKIGG